MSKNLLRQIRKNIRRCLHPEHKGEAFDIFINKYKNIEHRDNIYFTALTISLLRANGYRAPKHLLRQLHRHFTNSGWRYAPDLPCDLDDTACCIAALGKSANSRQIATFIRLLLEHEVTPGGPYYTWVKVVPCKNDIDPVVNVNIAFALNELEIPLSPNFLTYLQAARFQPISPYYSKCLAAYCFLRAGLNPHYQPVNTPISLAVALIKSPSSILRAQVINAKREAKNTLEGLIVEQGGAPARMASSHLVENLIIKLALFKRAPHENKLPFNVPAFVSRLADEFAHSVSKSHFLQTQISAVKVLGPSKRQLALHTLIWLESYTVNLNSDSTRAVTGQLLWCYRVICRECIVADHRLAKQILFAAELSLTASAKRPLRLHILAFVPLILSAMPIRESFFQAIQEILLIHQIHDDILDQDQRANNGQYQKASKHFRRFKQQLISIPEHFQSERKFLQIIARPARKQLNELRKKHEIFTILLHIYRPTKYTR